MVGGRLSPVVAGSAGDLDTMNSFLFKSAIVRPRTRLEPDVPLWWPRVLSAAAAGLGLRIVFVAASGRGGLGGDALWYGWVSAEITRRHPIRFFADLAPATAPAPPRLTPTAQHGILFPLVLSPVRVLGITSSPGLQVVGAVLGAATVVVLAVLARELGGARVGVATAALAAISPVLIEDDSMLMSESLYGLLWSAALLAVVRLRRAPTIGRSAWLGVLIGLATLTRSEAAVLLSVLSVVMLWPRRRRWRVLVTAAAAAATLVGPWAVRNGSVFGRPTVTTNSGSVIRGANCHASFYGPMLGGWSSSCLDPPVRAADRDELAQSDRWRREGLGYVRTHERRLPVVMAARVGRTFDVFPLGFARKARDRQRLAGASWGFNLLCVITGLAVLVLAAAGVARASPEARLCLLGTVASVAVLVAISESLPRLRQPADLAALVLAGHALAGRVRPGGPTRRRDAGAVR
jgi:hypothetical protein